MTKISPYLLNLAGEYRICSELNKRGIFATITYGNRKGVDVYAISDRHERALKIEVKTTQRGNFVTNITRKHLADDPNAPDFWVLFQIQPGKAATFRERFFILTHKEICRAQKVRNDEHEKKYFAKYGKKPDPMKGVDNVTIADVEQFFEDQWDKIKKRLGGSASG